MTRGQVRGQSQSGINTHFTVHFSEHVQLLLKARLQCTEVSISIAVLRSASMLSKAIPEHTSQLNQPIHRISSHLMPSHLDPKRLIIINPPSAKQISSS